MLCCQVISTSKYREALVSRSIPIIPLLGINPSHPMISDRTQFTLLHTWCGKFVITHHQHALWVLDPSCSSVVATLAERLPIIDIICCKDSVYLLRPDKSPIVKLTIHADFKQLVAPVKGTSDSSSDLSSTLDSGSFQSSVEESTKEHSSKEGTELPPVVNNTTPISSKTAVLSSQHNISKDVCHKVCLKLVVCHRMFQRIFCKRCHRVCHKVCHRSRHKVYHRALRGHRPCQWVCHRAHHRFLVTKQPAGTE